MRKIVQPMISMVQQELTAVVSVVQVALVASAAAAVLVALTISSHHFLVAAVDKAIRLHHVKVKIYNTVSTLNLKRRFLVLKKKLAIIEIKHVTPVMAMVLNRVQNPKLVISVAVMVRCKSRVIHLWAV